MKTLLLSTFDISGGAARAAYRLHQGLRNSQVDSQMLVQVKQSDDYQVKGTGLESGSKQILNGSRLILDQLPTKLYPHRNNGLFSPQWMPDNLASKVTEASPDIVNIHWTNSSYLKIETLAKINKPLVWTLHDMWAFTGGCHYSQECDRYITSCGACPHLSSQKDNDLSRWIWQRKAKAWKNLNLTVVALSSWLADCARSSSLFKDVRIELIPNGLDINQYRPIDRQIARKILGLPQDKQLVLFGSVKATSDSRKGFHLLQPALESLSQSGWQTQLELIIFGASKPENPPEFGFRTHYLGTLGDDSSLALVYSAADVFVLPSIQENLANTVMEAIACGTPCVTFAIGGMPDMVVHLENGYLARPYRVEELAQGIAWVLEDEERHLKLRHEARKKACESFTQELQAKRYISLFSELLIQNLR